MEKVARQAGPQDRTYEVLEGLAARAKSARQNGNSEEALYLWERIMQHPKASDVGYRSTAKDMIKDIIQVDFGGKRPGETYKVVDVASLNVLVSARDAVPPLSDSEYEELKASIAELGQIVPIHITKDLKILSGYHRVKACKELDVRKVKALIIPEPATKEEVITYAIHENVKRRQLTPSGRQEIIEKLQKFQPKISEDDEIIEEKKTVPHGTPSVRALAKELGVGKSTIQRDKKTLLEKQTERAEKIRDARDNLGYKPVARSLAYEYASFTTRKCVEMKKGRKALYENVWAQVINSGIPIGEISKVKVTIGILIVPDKEVV